MKQMDVVMYRHTVIKGKEDIANEWLAFLDEIKERGSEILVEENGYYEAYFTHTENDTMYIYITFASDDVDFSNNKAFESKNPLDVKHFEYMKACVDFEKVVAMPAKIQLNTF